jgi:tRNA-dihydrouridine synthase
MTVNIKNVSIEGYAALAPMAGVACRAMRRVAREFGAAFAVGEMASAKGIVLAKTARNYWRPTPKKRKKRAPLCRAAFRRRSRVKARAAPAAAQYGPDIIDMNFGCPP